MQAILIWRNCIGTKLLYAISLHRLWYMSKSLNSIISMLVNWGLNLWCLLCPSSAERCGAVWSATLSAYARPNSMWQAMYRSPFGLLGTKFYVHHNFINTTCLQKYWKYNTITAIIITFQSCWWLILLFLKVNSCGMVSIFWLITSMIYKLAM